MEHTINLVVGDWSGDGHERTYHETIASNLNVNDLVIAYHLGARVLGFDIQAMCNDYEDSKLPKEFVKKLVETGFYTEEERPDLDEPYRTSDYEFIDIWLHIAKLGNPDLKFQKVKGASIKIGGYGLFH